MRPNWETKRLDDLCNIELGKTPYRGDKSFWDNAKETDNVWLSIADLLNTEGNVVFDSKEYITNKAVKVSKVVKKGTLLLSFKLTLGRLAFAGKDLFTNEAIAALTIKNEKVIDKYFLYQSLSLFDWNAATEGDVKVKGRTLNKAKLKEIEVHYPKSIPEQKRIVAILDKAFAAIAKAKDNAEQNLNSAKELFGSYLQEVFENRGEGWEVRKLGEVYDVRDGTHDSPKYVKEGYALITSKNLKNDVLNYDKVNYITRKDYININKRSQVDVGDILFAMIGTIGNPIVIQNEPDFAIKNVALFKVPETQNSYFLKYI